MCFYVAFYIKFTHGGYIRIEASTELFHSAFCFATEIVFVRLLFSVYESRMLVRTDPSDEQTMADVRGKGKEGKGEG